MINSMSKNIFTVFITYLLMSSSISLAKESHHDKIERKITERLEISISRIVKKEHFKVNVRPSFRIQKTRGVFLGKLGFSKQGRSIEKVSKVVVYLSLDKDIAPDKVKAVKEIILETTPYVGKRSIKIEIERVKINKVNAGLSEFIDKIENMLKKYPSLFLSLFGIIALSVFVKTGKSKKVINRFKTIMDDKVNMLKKGPKGPVRSAYGLSLFLSMIDEGISKTSFVIKSWLYNKPSGYEEALAYIARSVTPDTFFKLFRSLGAKSQKEWKRIIVKHEFEFNDQSAESFLISSCISYLERDLSMSEVKSVSVLLDLTDAEILSFVEQKPSLHIEVIDLLSSEKKEWLLKNLSIESRQKIIKFEENKSESGNDLVELSENLSNYQETRSINKETSFVKRILKHKLFLSQGELTEIYKELAREASMEEKEIFFRSYFPVSLFLEMNDEVMSEVLSRFGTSLKKDLIIAFEEEASFGKLIKILRKDQNLAKDTNLIVENKFLIKKIKDNKEEIINTMTSELWNFVRNNDYFYHDIRESLISWIETDFTEGTKTNDKKQQAS